MYLKIKVIGFNEINFKINCFRIARNLRVLHDIAESCDQPNKVDSCTEIPNLFSLEEFKQLDEYFVMGGFNDIPIFDKLTTKDNVDCI